VPVDDGADAVANDDVVCILGDDAATDNVDDCTVKVTANNGAPDRRIMEVKLIICASPI
jgi:hypothetical protein